MSFHKNFRTLRKGFHLSQEQMAKVLHISRTTVSNYERGRMEPSIQTLKDIAQFLASRWIRCFGEGAALLFSLPSPAVIFLHLSGSGFVCFHLYTGDAISARFDITSCILLSVFYRMLFSSPVLGGSDATHRCYGSALWNASPRNRALPPPTAPAEHFGASFPPRRHYIQFVFYKEFYAGCIFYLFSSVCAADKWRFFTEKLLCPRFASPAKWRFITEKIENFSIFSPLSGACAVLAPDNLRVGCHFFRKKTHVAIWKTVWYGICKKVYPREISVQKNS